MKYYDTCGILYAKKYAENIEMKTYIRYLKYIIRTFNFLNSNVDKNAKTNSPELQWLRYRCHYTFGAEQFQINYQVTNQNSNLTDKLEMKHSNLFL